MPLTYQIDHARRLVNVRGHGLLTPEDFLQYQRNVWGRSDVAGYNEIVDMSDVSSIDVQSVDRVRELAELSAHMDSPTIPSKFAIVASDPLAYQLGRLYETYRELKTKSTKRVRAFTAREDALRWLESADEGKQDEPG